MITQIKERNNTGDSNIENWFNNKVLRKAKRQIKDTISYFEIYKDISIQNEKGRSILNVSEARKIEPIKLIIYSPGKLFPESLDFKNFIKAKMLV
ncbi:MAG: hypothetical protein R2759_01715 [Bacteroidales bacterium]